MTASMMPVLTSADDHHSAPAKRNAPMAMSTTGAFFDWMSRYDWEGLLTHGARYANPDLRHDRA